MGFLENFNAAKERKKKQQQQEAAKPILTRGVQSTPTFSPVQPQAIPQTLNSAPVNFNQYQQKPTLRSALTIPALNQVKETGQGFMRSTAATGAALTALPEQARAFVTNTPVAPGTGTFQPQGQFQQKLYGTDKPISFQSQGAELGIKNPTGATLAGAALSTLDLTGAGKGKAVKKIASTLNPEDIRALNEVFHKINSPQPNVFMGIQQKADFVLNHVGLAGKSPEEIKVGIQNIAAQVGKEKWQAAVQRDLAVHPPPQAVPTSVTQKPPNQVLTSNQALKFVNDNYQNIIPHYLSAIGKEFNGASNVISADAAKYTIPGYSGEHAPAYHEASSAFAKRLYKDLLQSKKGTANNTVLFTAGGTGAGKTQALRDVGTDLNQYSIVYDTNLTGDSALTKIQQALDNGYKVEVTFVHRDPVKSFSEGVLPRVSKENRTVTIDEHIARHTQAPETLRQAQERFGDNPNFTVRYIDNTGAKGAAKVVNIDELPFTEYNNLYDELNTKLNNAEKVSQVTPQQAQAIRGQVRPENGSLSQQAGTRGIIDRVKAAFPPMDERGAIKNPFGGEPKPQPGTELPQTQPTQRTPPSRQPTALTPQQSLSLSNDINVLKRAPEINLSKLAISKQGKDVIKQTAEEIKPRLSELIGKPLSNAEVIKNAEASAKTFKAAVGREQTKEWTTALLNTRQKFADMAETGVVDREFIQTLATLRSIASDAGRKLQSFAIEAKPADITLKQYMLENMLDLGHNIDDLVEAAKGVDFNNYNEASAFYRKFVKPSFGEMVDLLRYNSMLTSPLTHIVNIASNLANSSIFAPVEKAVVGSFDFLQSAATGKAQERFAGEGGAFLKGYYENIGEAARRFGKSLRGDVPTTNLDTRQIPLTQKGTALNKVENTLAAPLKFLEATDQFFTALTEGGERAALTYRQSKGVKIDDFEKKVSTAALYRLYREEPGREGQGKLLGMIDGLTQILQSARNHKDPTIRTIAKFTFPFVRTPTNIFKQGVEYSPLGVFNLYGADDKQTVLARAAIGSAVAAGAATLLASGRLTWAEPSNEAEKNAFKAAGKQPYSVKFGDTWVSYQKLPPPLAFPISMIAAINDAIENKKMDESTGQLVLSAVAKYGSFLSDQSYAKSMGDLVSALQFEESSLSKLFSNYPQQLIPYRALGGWLARITDHVQRKPDPDGTYIEKQVQYLMMNIPGLSDNVPARTDEQGNEIRAQNPVLNSFSPVRTSTENPEKAADYQGILDIKNMERDATARNNLLKDEAEDIVASLGAKTKGEQRRELSKLKRSNPALYEKVQDLQDVETGDYTAYEKKLKNASVETRAQMILKQMKGMDKTDQRILLSEYKKKKIISDSVSDRIKELQRETR